MNNSETPIILVVDDNKANIEVIFGYLKQLGFIFLKAENGQDAMNIVTSQPVDLILLDVMMPVMDGFETCKKIKEDENIKDIPIIFITARTEMEDVVKGFQVGGNDYLPKPFYKEELIARVKNLLELKQAKDLIKKQLAELQDANRFILGVLHQYSKFVEKERNIEPRK